MKNTKLIKIIVGLAIIIFLVYAGLLLFGIGNKNTTVITTQTATTGITYTTAIVSTHNVSTNCWIIVNNNVYDVTQYISQHPGGAKEILDYCGKESTTAYKNRGGHGTHSTQANASLAQYLIGSLGQ